LYACGCESGKSSAGKEKEERKNGYKKILPERKKLLSKKKREKLTEGQGIGLNDQPVVFSLICGEGGDLGLRLFPLPGLLLQLLPQLRAGVGEVLQALIELGLSGSLRLLELPTVPEFSLH
jgi:hypothetical protein